jgi:outer membrane immunogenic protein
LRWADADLSAGAYSFPGFGGQFPAIFGFTIPTRSEEFHPDSVIFGLHGGYNYQFSPNWLMGIETDISWGKGDDTTRFLVSDGFGTSDPRARTLARTSTLELGWQASVRGRFGWVAGPFLFYGTGGVAFARADWNETWVNLAGLPPTSPPSTSVSTSKTLTGWTAGFGVDHLYPTGWLIRAEYLYTDYGDFTVPLGFTTLSGQVGIATHVVRAGASYKFGP